MHDEVRSLRRRLALTGFVATYGMVLILLTAVWTADEQVDELLVEPGSQPAEETGTDGGAGDRDDRDRDNLDRGEGDGEIDPLVLATAVLLLPAAAASSWWWSGRAVRPVARSLTLQRHLIEETSHELRTPLSILTTNAEILLADPEPTLDGYRRGLERSADVADRMGRVIETLLVDARGRTRVIDRRPVDLVRLVRSAVDTLAPVAADAGITLQVVADGAVRAKVDPSTVERAVSNLVANGVRHGPTGSIVVVEVTSIDGDVVEISVTDQGSGIAPEDQAAIFERYWRGQPSDGDDRGDQPDGAGDGSGLGLAIVRQVAVAHGGSVGVESPVADGRGTRLRLTLLS